MLEPAMRQIVEAGKTQGFLALQDHKCYYHRDQANIPK